MHVPSHCYENWHLKYRAPDNTLSVKGPRTAKDEARKICDAYREAGGNFVDTANLYTNGASERLVGEFMESHRQEIVLATKYANSAPGRDPNAAGNQRKMKAGATAA